MEKRMRFILIGFILLLGVSVFSNLQTYNSRQIITRQRDDFKKENASLLKKIDESLQDNQRVQDKLSSLKRELDISYKDKEEVDRKYDLLLKEREELVQKLKTQATRPAPQAQMPQSTAGQEDAYWAGILKAKTDLELKLDNLSNELKTIQIKDEELERHKNNLELEVNNLNRQTQDLKRQLEYNQKITDKLSQDLVRERNDKFQVHTDSKLIKNENLILRRQLRSLSNRKIDLEKRLAALKKDNKGLIDKLNEMDALLQEKTLEMVEKKERLEAGRYYTQPITERKEESIELPPIIVRPREETSQQGMTVSRIAKVLAVNKDNNFVIIDLGEEGGVRVTDTFQVYQQDKPIASIEVVQTRKNISACDIKKQSASIKIGDTVR